MMTLKKVRMASWLVVSLVLMATIALIAPQQLPVSLYKLSLITSAAWVAYWIDRSLFPYARPGCMLDKTACSNTNELGFWGVVFAASMMRRAVIIAAAMIGVALGA